MFVLQMLNDGDEWELCPTLFKSHDSAKAFFDKELSCFESHDITEMRLES